MVESVMTSSNQRKEFLERLAAAAEGVDPSGRLESVAFLLGRISTGPRYEFRLSGGRPLSWSFLSDLGAIQWQGVVPIGDPIDRIAAIQVQHWQEVNDRKLDQLRQLLKGYTAEKLDHLAGLVFVQDLLASTGRSTDDEAVIDKYWTTLPEKRRPSKEDLPLTDAQEVYALAA
jgi:hypothetical protein